SEQNAAGRGGADEIEDDGDRVAVAGDNVGASAGGLELAAEGRHRVSATLVAERAALAQRDGAAGTIADLDGLADAGEKGVAFGVVHCPCPGSTVRRGLLSTRAVAGA